MVATTVCVECGVADAEATAADRLFDALDARRITPGPDGPRVEIVGIHALPDGIWMQVAVAGESMQGVILHLPRWASVDHAIAALKVWGEAPTDDRPHLIHVMSPV